MKRKANYEASVKQTGDRLERAQLLSYSLEEESERWKSNLMEVERNLQVLVGNCTVSRENQRQKYLQGMLETHYNIELD